jgi:hypothetical protein
VLGKRLALVAALVLVASEPARAQTKRDGSWSAATSTGQTLIGYWTADLDTAGTVTGTWTLVDAQGVTRADGTWSAAKAPNGWTGAWRALVAGRDGEFSGTWSATVGGRPNARLADLFAAAARAVVSGTWRLGQRSGAWSVRTFP